MAHTIQHECAVHEGLPSSDPPDSRFALSASVRAAKFHTQRHDPYYVAGTRNRGQLCRDPEMVGRSVFLATVRATQLRPELGTVADSCLGQRSPSSSLLFLTWSTITKSQTAKKHDTHRQKAKLINLLRAVHTSGRRRGCRWSRGRFCFFSRRSVPCGQRHKWVESHSPRGGQRARRSLRQGTYRYRGTLPMVSWVDHARVSGQVPLQPRSSCGFSSLQVAASLQLSARNARRSATVPEDGPMAAAGGCCFCEPASPLQPLRGLEGRVVGVQVRDC
ncbi:hypothetical protein B0J11DRAFT_77932 [Dendryphion nanum]|uniref:Uncharacterized protein n=1 Tax=Dendryphion nanum TaxID=256645 RepID=A0A9P9DG64_9PLEO|nr:hypothetical protein B0J11DRAFT_77932 [Dendryphion nanum]